jgi:hypothetical protein
VAEQLKRFALSHAPNVGIGVIDSQGFRLFHGFGLEKLNSERSAPLQAGLPVHRESSSHLFSDLNQWMMKILLAASIPESLLSVPRNEYRSGRQLAQAARVSVHGVAPHLYLERLDADALKQLGLSVENAGGRPDVYIRIPENKEAAFRPVVRHEGVPVADIVQVWLDVSNHPERGKEQADQIWKRVLAPSIRKEHQ